MSHGVLSATTIYVYIYTHVIPNCIHKTRMKATGSFVGGRALLLGRRSSLRAWPTSTSDLGASHIRVAQNEGLSLGPGCGSHPLPFGNLPLSACGLSSSLWDMSIYKGPSHGEADDRCTGLGELRPSQDMPQFAGKRIQDHCSH